MIGLGFKEDIGSLSRCYNNRICLEWLDIDGINVHCCESMVGVAKEEFIIECSIDHP